MPSKYSSPNGTVQVSSTEEDTCVSIVVQDSGIGIPDDEQDQIFSKFLERRMP